MKLIGIGGTDASGKDTVAEMLVERHGWQFISVSEILRDELTKRGVVLKRENLRVVSAEWRRKHGLGVLIDKAVEQYDKKHPGLVISSLRNYGEAEEVQRLGGKVVWVDANTMVRYKRITGRNRGTEDQVTYDEFVAEEKAQMHHQDDHHSLNLSGVMELADISLENNGSDVEVFKNVAEAALKPYL